MSSTVSLARVTWTYEDYCQFPEDGNRYEVIDGELLVTPAPTTTHQIVSGRIHLALMLQVQERGLGVVFAAPTDVITSQTRVMQPDLLVVRTERRNIVSERGIEGAPDLVVEIASPGTAARDRGLKRKLYASIGVAEYWLVDPSSRTIEVLRLAGADYALHGSFGPGQQVSSTLWQIELAVDRVFAA